MSYAKHLSRSSTPQTEALPGQVANSAGGNSFGVDCWTRLDRFLVLGCEGGSYYASERKLTRENAAAVLDCARTDTLRTIKRIAEISKAGRAPKNDPAIFALALLAATNEPAAYSGQIKPIGAYGFDTISNAALFVLNDVCRTGTHLFHFVEAVTEFRGWGRALKDAVAQWYHEKGADKLAYQVTKYAQRNGWSHRDLLRLSHPVPQTPGHKDVFQYVTQREKWQKSTRPGTRMLVFAEEAKTASIERLCKLIREEGLVREHIPTEHLNSPEIWEALLENMPITALIRNLNKLTLVGLLKPLSTATSKVVNQLNNADMLREGRVHPFNLLVALKTYASGRGFRGDLTWTPVPQVVSALEDAFYTAFGTIEPTGKNHLFGIDVSGSMTMSTINNTNVQPRSAAACLAMVGMRTEPASYAFGFTDRFQDLGISPRDRLDRVEDKVQNSNFGRTDCAVPMIHALQHRMEVDAFVVLTDSETYAGRQHPTVALENYRQKMGRDTKLIVVGMVSNEFTIADPKDPGQLDVVGFDTSAPSVIADFVREEVPGRRRAAAARKAA